MGYKARTYKLVFEDPGLKGLEVRARGITIDQTVQLLYLLGLGTELLSPAREDERAELYQTMGDGLIDWNLEDDHDEPVPLTAKTLRAQEWSLVTAIAHEWLTVQTSVPAPLDPSSSAGEPSAELSIPVEPLSASPPSLSAPN